MFHPLIGNDGYREILLTRICVEGMGHIKSEEYLDALNELRTVVLVECEGGHFHQVMVPIHIYKTLTDLISVPIKPEVDDLKAGYELRGMDVKHDWKIDADKLIGLQSTYLRKEITANRKAFIAENEDDDEI